MKIAIPVDEKNIESKVWIIMESRLKIAVLRGKGGTGKTTVATAFIKL